uniref:Uncharacterized protein n=1 Tax=Chromera velia CCMP2878 TaxID=1169474 RepID=A0A0G4FBX5_9ALVE|mmetsp:Transcript_43105/g.84988  ORF Transcript_43105/g.84988 Transcript_43105/m.84988 type:complete len:503 (+) Transcript_43105:118-1626(+)|eukprot:Cvel_16101.t1-p1 / transcript=Cvel_16101.t1 / gene=Cvel_16101 / organism=Chromera_velia_CCMP2878 / gene_product=Epoxide hydrolase 1, putative / transcript_product=Epoxide hydrolase 1, putative / location=Cvel_scaffold1225:16351-19520(+) / protein_length=502 / sequence_SO=supercontig / SO=protein_coding / is_pseudo=false
MLGRLLFLGSLLSALLALILAFPPGWLLLKSHESFPLVFGTAEVTVPQGGWRPHLQFFKNSLSETVKEVSVEALKTEYFSHVTPYGEKAQAAVTAYLAEETRVKPMGRDEREWYFDSDWEGFLKLWEKEGGDVVWKPLETVTKETGSRHYVTQIEGLGVHFMVTEIEGKDANAPPLGLLLMNGWPSNLHEWLPLLSAWKKEKDLVPNRPLKIVTVSIPGLGASFSENPTRQFLVTSAAHVIRVLAEQRLAGLFERYIVCGTDWGALISEMMAIMVAREQGERKLAGIFHGMAVAASPPHELLLFQMHEGVGRILLQGEDEAVVRVFSSKRGAARELIGQFWERSAYQHMLNTRPVGTAMAMGTSPLSFCALVFEKFYEWSSLGRPDVSKTEREALWRQIASVCTMAGANRGMEAGFRYYRENIPVMYTELMRTRMPQSVPFALASFPGDPFSALGPERYLRLRYPSAIQVRRHSEGGHFPSLEVPLLLATDLRDFVNALLVG